MDQSANFPSGARRDEDIALDLLKFVASTTSVLRPSSPSAGFTAATPAKAEEQVTQLLDLYGRCLTAVQGSPATPAKAGR